MGCLGALGFLKMGVAVLGLFHSQELNKAFVGPSKETQGSGAQPGALPDRALLQQASESRCDTWRKKLLSPRRPLAPQFRLEY